MGNYVISHLPNTKTLDIATLSAKEKKATAVDGTAGYVIADIDFRVSKRKPSTLASKAEGKKRASRVTKGSK